MKKPQSFVFISQCHHSKPIRLEVITKNVNKLIHQVSKQLNDKPNITSHSFRIGYITQLWKDPKDIEFVKQTIGDRKLDTTSAYVTSLSDLERQERIKNI
jgi:site-specific recombinase XerD